MYSAIDCHKPKGKLIIDRQYVLSRWQKVRAGLLDTIDRFRDDELDFRPFPASWSVRRLMLHIAHEEYGEFAYGIAQTLKEFPPEYDDRTYPTLNDIKMLLGSVHAQTLAFLEKSSDADLSKAIQTPWGKRPLLIEMIDHMIEHELHHRGELSLVLGMLGREGLDA